MKVLEIALHFVQIGQTHKDEFKKKGTKFWDIYFVSLGSRIQEEKKSSLL